MSSLIGGVCLTYIASRYIMFRLMQADFVDPPLIPAPKTSDSLEDFEEPLADFSTKRHILLLSAMAVPIGAISALVAYALLWLIAVITNLAFYHRFSDIPTVPQGNRLG